MFKRIFLKKFQKKNSFPVVEETKLSSWPKRGFYFNEILGMALVDVYGKCVLLEDARKAF
jgi:hypothetical protein